MRKSGVNKNERSENQAVGNKMGVTKRVSHPRKAALGIIICARARDPNGPRLTGSGGSPEVQTGVYGQPVTSRGRAWQGMAKQTR